MKKILTVFLALTMLLGILAIAPVSAGAAEPEVWDGSVADAFAGGLGTAGSPYQIANGAQLAFMSQEINAGRGLNAYYKLTADIYLNEGEAKDFELNNARQFTAMGKWTPANDDGTKASQKSFGGTFDGDNHIISGLYQNGAENQGLFGNVSGGAVIKNFALLNSYVKTTDNETGAIAGQTDRNSSAAITFSNIYTDAIVVGNQKISGILGNISGTNASYTWFEAAPEVTMTSVVFAGEINASNSHIGAFVGYSADAKLVITDCMNIGSSISNSKEYSAGFIGRHEAATITMTRCISAGSVQAKEGLSSSNASRYAYFAASNKKEGTALVDCLYVEGILNTEASTYLYYNKKTSDTDTGATAIEITSLVGAKPEGWSNWTVRAGDIAIPTGIAVFDPEIMASEYTVTWKNHDGTVLATETYKYGETPTYKGETPTKAEDDKYTYNFNAWTPTVAMVTGDAEYTADFYRTRKSTGEAEDPTNEAEDDFAPVTTAQNESEVTEAPKTEEGGCGSVIGAGAVALVSIVGLAAVSFRKKED